MRAWQRHFHQQASGATKRWRPSFRCSDTTRGFRCSDATHRPIAARLQVTTDTGRGMRLVKMAVSGGEQTYFARTIDLGGLSESNWAGPALHHHHIIMPCRIMLHCIMLHRIMPPSPLYHVLFCGITFLLAHTVEPTPPPPPPPSVIL